MTGHSGRDSFEAVILPHLDAAFNLARWLMRNGEDAEDVVQDAIVRALSYFSGFRETNARGWFLQIVRNAAYASMKVNRGMVILPISQSSEDEAALPELIDPGDGPETTLLKDEDQRRLRHLLSRLPVELREILVLRELEELSYKEIAQIAEIPVGTVMSRLWRARRVLADAMTSEELAA